MTKTLGLAQIKAFTMCHELIMKKMMKSYLSSMLMLLSEVSDQHIRSRAQQK